MLKQIKQPVVVIRRLALLARQVALVLVLCLVVTGIYTYTRVGTQPTAYAAVGINHKINFQGKLVNPNGTNVTDGTYTIVFSIYTVASAGTNIWTETQTPTLSNGIFQVDLGAVTTLPGSVDFNTDNIYLGIKVGADAEMTPRVQFTSVPQAFNAEKLGGLDKTGFIQNTVSQQATSNFNISGAGVIGTTLTTPTLQSAASTALTITGNAASTWSTTAGALTLDAAATLNLGTTNATSVSVGNASATTTVNGNLTVAANKNLTLSSGTGTYSQTYTGTTGNALSITATGLTTGNALSVTAASSSTAASAIYASLINYNAAPASASSSGFVALSGLAQTAAGSFIGNNITGVYGQAANNSTSGNVSLAIGTSGQVLSTGVGGNITTAIGVQAAAPYIVAGTITNSVGFNGANQTAGTNNTNLLLGTSAAPAGNYSIYNSSAYNNYFAGNVGIGDTTPAALLTVGNGDLFQVNSTGAVSSSSSTGQVFFTGHQVGAGYATASGIFQAVTDNPTGSANIFFEGVTNNVTKFSVRADGLITGVGVNAGAGLLQGQAGLTVTGAAVNLNASSNFATNINTGTSTGAVTIGNGAVGNTFALSSNGGLNVTTAGALSGISTLALSGNLTQTAGSTISAGTGFKINGATATAGNYLRGNGTNFVSSAIQAADVPDLSATYIKNQSSLQATSNFHISGTGTADTSLSAPILVSTVATGTAPLTVTSTTLVNNLNVQYLNGLAENQLAQNLRSGYSLTGGGTVTYSAATLGWTSRFIVISNGNGADFSTGGYFNIDMPVNGTVITGVGGATNATVASGAVPLAAWQALYYILPVGGGPGTVNANFRVAAYTGALTVPSNWVLVAVHNSDNNTLRLGIGETLRNGQTITAGTIDNSVFNTSVSTPTITTASGDLTIDPTGNTIIKGSVATSASAALDIQNSAAGSILFARNDGNVGIGNAAPSYKLDVAGDIYSSTVVRILNTTANPGGSGILLPYSGSSPNTGASIRWTDGTLANTLGLYVNAGLNYQGNAGNPDFGIRQVTGTGSLGSLNTLFSGASTPGNSYINALGGNVGIGTTSPNTKLQVVGGAGIQGSIAANTGFNGNNLSENVNSNSFASGLNMTTVAGSTGGTHTADGKFVFNNNALAWTGGFVSNSSYARVADRVLEWTVDTSAAGVSTAQADHMMVGWGDGSLAGSSYTHLAYALYFTKPISGAYDLSVYEDGISRTTLTNITWGDVLTVRVVLKATGADYYYKLNNGVWKLGYVSTYSTATPLYPSIAPYAGRFTLHSMHVYDQERTISLDNGKVGIGTTTPGTKLDVSGGIWTSNAGSGRNAAYDLAGGAVAVGSSLYSYGYICTGNTLGTCNGTGGVVLGPANTGAGINLNNSGSSFFNAGSVGIGNTAPSRSLDVAANVVHSTSGLTSQLSVRGTANTTNKLNIGYDTTSNYGFIEAVNESVAWQHLALQPSGGNVGIGLVPTNASAKFSVQGIATVPVATFYTAGGAGTSNGVLVYGGTTSADFSLNVKNAADTQTQLYVRGDGNVGIGTNAPLELLSLGKSGGSNAVLSFSGSTSGKVTIQTAVAAGTYTLTLPTSQASGVQQLQNDGAGNLSWATPGACGTCIVQGPTTTAQNTITPVTSAVVGLTVNGTNTGTAATALVVNQSLAANLAVLDATSSTANGVSIDVQSSTTSQYALSVTSNNGATNGLYVRADGNVGIGTNTPGNKLTFVADSTAGSGSAFYAVFGGSQSTANTGTYNSLYVDPYYTAASGNTLANLVGGYTEPRNNSTGTITNMFSLLANNVNVSTGSIGNAYGVWTQGVENRGVATVTNAYGLYAIAANNQSTGTITNAYGAYIAAPLNPSGTITNKYALITEAGAGNVGIRTLTPSNQLQVGSPVGQDVVAKALGIYFDDGLTNAEHYIGEISRGTSANRPGLGFGYRADGTNATSALLKSFNNLPLTIATSSTLQAITVLDNGNVGIGTAAPATKLEVNGGAGNGNVNFDVAAISPTIRLTGVGQGGNIWFAANNQNSLLSTIQYGQGGGFTGNILRVVNNATTNSVLTFGATDNVGIGVGATTPTSLLHVAGTQPAPAAAGTAATQVLQVTGGTGGNASGSGTLAGAGAAITINTGNGGTSSAGTNIKGGDGGDITIQTGNGGASTGTASNSNAGDVVIKLGTAGTGGSGAAGTQGKFEVVAQAGNEINRGFFSSQYSNDQYAGQITGRKARGTYAAPSAILANDTILNFQGQGYAGATDTWKSGTQLRVEATQNWSTGFHGSKFVISTASNSGGAFADRFVVDHNGNVGIGSNLTPTRTLDVNGSWGGSQYVRTTDSTTVSSTITDAHATELVYVLQANKTNTASNTKVITTYNLTGLPAVDGTFVIITLKASHPTSTGGATTQQCVRVQADTSGINLNSADVCDVAGNTASTSIGTLMIVRVNGQYMGVGGSPANNTGAVISTADLAEWIPTTGTLPQAGDIVTAGDDPVSVKRSSTAYDSKLVGIVSTDPHTTFGQETPTSVRLALAGRVPVHVSAQNGPIHKGDPITSSSVAGVGMKATAAGRIIGTALEDFDGSGVGEVTVLVGSSFYTPPAGTLIQGLSNFEQISVMGAANIASLNVSGATTLTNLTVTGNVIVQGTLTVVGPIAVGDITVSGHVVSAGDIPTVEPGTKAGQQATVVVTGNDTSGTIEITTGSYNLTNPAAVGDLAKLIFVKAFGKEPGVNLTPKNAAASGLQYYITASANDFTLNSNNVPQPNTTYIYHYLVVE